MWLAYYKHEIVTKEATKGPFPLNIQWGAMTSMKIKPMSPMEMTKEACQQDKTPFDLSNDFGPLRQPRT